MKTSVSYLIKVFAAMIFCFFIVVSASAQRPSRGGPVSRGPAPRPPRVSGPVHVYRPPVRYYGPRYVYPRYYHGYYGPYRHYYSPWVGVRLRVLPWGYISFNFGPDLFYYYDGIFYRNIDDSYEVVAPPVGAEVPSLPRGSREIRINGEQFFEKNGVYYKEVIRDDNTKAYVVAGKDGELNTSESALPQEGDIVEQLPADCRPVTINGQEYYAAPNGFYYQEINDDGTTVYKVVGSASVEPENNNK